jgi:hypothetical protein
MVGFASYIYIIPWDTRDKWATLLCKAFYGVAVEFSAGSKKMCIKCKNPQDVESALLSFFTTKNNINPHPSIMQADVINVWNRMSFWNMMPKPDWDKTQYATVKPEDTDIIAFVVKSIDSMKNGSPEREVFWTVDDVVFPMEYISVILRECSKGNNPIVNMFYSPSSGRVVMRFKNGIQLNLLDGILTNLVDCQFDFDDGPTATNMPELETDFEEWKAQNTQSPNVFHLRSPFVGIE